MEPSHRLEKTTCQHLEWDHITGKLLNSMHNIGSVKEFVYYGMSDEAKKTADFTVVKVPQFCEYTGSTNEWKRIEQRNTIQICSIEHGSRNVRASNSLDSVHATKKNVQDVKVAGVVQEKRSSTEASQRQLLTAKQMTKYIKRNEPVYLAFIRPNPVQRSQGMTQKTKRDQMK